MNIFTYHFSTGEYTITNCYIIFYLLIVRVHDRQIGQRVIHNL